MKSNDISHLSTVYLHQRLDYNPIIGELRWNRKNGTDRATNIFNSRDANNVAGYHSEAGYIVVGLHGGQVKIQGEWYSWFSPVGTFSKWAFG